jgi:hypothetical protein
MNEALPPPLERVDEDLDEENEDLPGHIYKDRIKRDEAGKLIKSYLRFNGFSAPYIDAYNHMVTMIIVFLVDHFSLELDDGSIVTINSVKFEPPCNSDGEPIYPKEIEMSKDSYLANLQVNFIHTRQHFVQPQH